MKTILFFDSMLTPKIIVFVYWLALFSATISGLFTMFSSYGGFFSGLGIILFGCIGARIWCELLVVLFKINENLKRLADKETSGV